jgi:hypothetical protein
LNQRSRKNHCPARLDGLPKNLPLVMQMAFYKREMGRRMEAMGDLMSLEVRA